MDKKSYFTAEIHGMCGGVHAALDMLGKLTASRKQGIFVFNELVHNHAVTDDFVRRGVTFVNRISDIPEGAVLVIGAHGVAPEVEKALRSRAGECCDATCPLVKKLHRIAEKVSPDEELIIFGKAGHPEVQGVAGYSGTKKLFLISSIRDVDLLPEMDSPVFISQTTVDHSEVREVIAALRRRYAGLRESSGVCDASQKRQNAVLKLVRDVELILVVGSSHSSNARRLCEIAENAGCPAFLIDNAAEITPEMLAYSRIGITSGASTPQYLFDEVIKTLVNNGFVSGR